MGDGKTKIDQQVETGQRRGTGARGHQPHLVDGLAHDAQPVEEGGGNNDRRAVLVVVEYGNAHALP